MHAQLMFSFSETLLCLIALLLCQDIPVWVLWKYGPVTMVYSTSSFHQTMVGWNTRDTPSAALLPTPPLPNSPPIIYYMLPLFLHNVGVHSYCTAFAGADPYFAMWAAQEHSICLCLVHPASPGFGLVHGFRR